MPQDKRTAQECSRLPVTEAAALAALSVSESLMLAMVESGCLDRRILSRCLLDAATAHDKSSTVGNENSEARQAIHAETVKLIDCLLQQVEAVAPSRPVPDGTGGRKSTPL